MDTIDLPSVQDDDLGVVEAQEKMDELDNIFAELNEKKGTAQQLRQDAEETAQRAEKRAQEVQEEIQDKIDDLRARQTVAQQKSAKARNRATQAQGRAKRLEALVDFARGEIGILSLFGTLIF